MSRRMCVRKLRSICVSAMGVCWSFLFVCHKHAMQHLLQHISFCVSQDTAADAAYRSEMKNVPVRCLTHVRAYSVRPHVCITCAVRNRKVPVQMEERLKLETFLSERHRNIDSCIFVTAAKKSKSRAKPSSGCDQKVLRFHT